MPGTYSPHWTAAVHERADGRFDILLDVAGQSVASRAEAEEIAAFFVAHLDARLPDVALQLAAAAATPPAPTPAPAPAAKRPVGTAAACERVVERAAPAFRSP